MEASLPFNRIHVQDMHVAIELAKAECGGGDSITLKKLREQLPTEAWAALDDKQSNLVKVLLSSCFGSEETESDDPKINADNLKMWALLHCQGSNDSKAVAFYEILQEGGLSAHEQISASDKDFAPAFERICKFVSEDVIKFSVDLMGAESLYSQDEIAKLVNPELIEILREDVWLDQVYGNTSRVHNEEWLKAVAKTASWIFKPAECRK